MMVKRKKTVPKVKRIRILKKKLLTIWAKIAKEQQGNKCQICGSSEFLNAHHIVPKEKKDNALKYDLQNAIVLCPRHHKYSYDLSPHKNPLTFFALFTAAYPTKYNYLLKHASDIKVYTEEELTELLKEFQEQIKEI